jgi:hypothetical protein
MNKLEQRIRKLERQNRFCKAALFSAALIVCAVGAGKSDHVPDRITAKEIVIVDNNGNRTISILTDESGQGRINIMNDGNTSLSLGADAEQGGAIFVYDTEMNEKAVLSSALNLDTGKLAGALHLMNAEGTAVVQIESTKDGGGTVAVTNSKKRPAVAIGSMGDKGIFIISDDDHDRHRLITATENKTVVGEIAGGQ